MQAHDLSWLGDVPSAALWLSSNELIDAIGDNQSLRPKRFQQDVPVDFRPVLSFVDEDMIPGKEIWFVGGERALPKSGSGRLSPEFNQPLFVGFVIIEWLARVARRQSACLKQGQEVAVTGPNLNRAGIALAAGAKHGQQSPYVCHQREVVSEEENPRPFLLPYLIADA